MWTNLFVESLLRLGIISIFLRCLTVTSTYPTNFVVPKWTYQLSNENLTDTPKFVIQLQDSLLYPTRALLQKMFSSQYHIDKSRMLQVRLKREIPFEISKFTNHFGFFFRKPRSAYWNPRNSIATLMALGPWQDLRVYTNWGQVT